MIHTVWMEHLGDKTHCGRFVWVVFSELQCQLEGTWSQDQQSISFGRLKQKTNLRSTLGQIKIAKNIPSLKFSYYFDNISTKTCQRKLIACSFHKEWKVGVQIPPSQGVSSGLQRIETWIVSPHSTSCIFYKILNKQTTKNQRPLKKHS